MNTILNIALVIVVVLSFIFNNAKMIQAEQRLQNMQQNVDVLNNFFKEAIDALKKFNDDLNALNKKDDA